MALGGNDTCSWDEGKRERVFAERGIDFADLAPFFADEYAVTRIDDRRDYGEARFNMLASAFGVVLNITFTPRGRRFHIITARLANRKERTIHAEAQSRS